VDGVTYTLAYDEEDRIEAVTDTQASQTWIFQYDGNGTRVRQVNPDGSQLLLLNGGRYHVRKRFPYSFNQTAQHSVREKLPPIQP
jgi:hypothetical protein